MKKLISVFLAIVLVLSLYAAAVAAEGENLIDKEHGTIAGADKTVTWIDTFKVSANAPNTQNLPAATFNYAITAGVADDATESSPRIRAGVGTPTIKNDAVHAATDVGTYTHSVKVTADFSTVDFPEAGIYRYTVKETLDSSHSAADIKIDTGNSNTGDYVLDVYVQKNNDNTISPYAYVLFKKGTAITLTKTEDENGVVTQTTTYAGKVDEIVNELTTYDLTITKRITGSAAANAFAFTIDINGIPTDVYVKQDSNAAVAGAESGANEFTATLANGESTVIRGLPSTVTYSILETVNKLEGYDVKVTVNNETSTAYDWSSNNTRFGNTAKTQMGQNNNTIVFTNHLDNISPTGVVLRVAPYALILIAGVALLLISRRRKTEKE